jgi:hypothetical protein
METRVAVSFLEGSKTRPLYLQIVDPYSLYLYDTDTARRPKHEINLQQSVCEIYSHDVSGRAISVISPSAISILTFSSNADATNYLALFNSKSDIFKDRQSMQQLDRHLETIWPFPLRE